MVCWRPRLGSSPSGSLLFVPPFAEEANKSRRMVALTARALADAGFLVLRVDLLGCGDSAGELRDASWADWEGDLERAWSWLQREAKGRTMLWSLRAGALLAASLSVRLDLPAAHLLWQPVTSGRNYLNQFLRLRVAAEAVATGEGRDRATTSALLTRLRAGETVEVAGYELPPDVALPVSSVELALPQASTSIDWIEVDSREPPSLLPASLARAELWRADGLIVNAKAVSGPPFWQTQEIEDCPALVSATLEAVEARLN